MVSHRPKGVLCERAYEIFVFDMTFLNIPYRLAVLTPTLESRANSE